jgi:hypothetical protein
MNCYEVYAYLDPRYPGCYCYGDLKFDYKPVYVGKGSKRWKRKFVHLKRSNNKRLKNLLHNLYKNKIKPIVLTIFDNLVEEKSLELETSVIKLIGREDKSEGPLFNHTDGGEGHRGIILTSEQLDVKRQNMKKYWSSLTQEQRLAIGEKSKQNRTAEGVAAGIIKRKKTWEQKDVVEKQRIETQRFNNWRCSLDNRTEEQNRKLSQICKYASTQLRPQYYITLKDLTTGIVETKFMLDWLKDGFVRDGIMERIKTKSCKPLVSRTTKRQIVIVHWEKIAPASVF